MVLDAESQAGLGEGLPELRAAVGVDAEEADLCLAVHRQHDLLEDAGHGGRALATTLGPGEAEAARAVDEGVLPDRADALELAEVHRVGEELGAHDGRAEVQDPRSLDGADLAQGPLGERAALGGRERLRGGESQTAAQTRAAQHVAYAAVADPPGAVAGEAQGAGDGAL